MTTQTQTTDAGAVAFEQMVKFLLAEKPVAETQQK